MGIHSGDGIMAEATGQEIKTHLSNRATWVRLLFMLLFVVIFNLAELVLGFAVLFQFVHALITGGPNARVGGFGENLGRYVYQILRYLTYNTEDRPFPFADWPGAAPDGPRAPRRSPPARRPKAGA